MFELISAHKTGRKTKFLPKLAVKSWEDKILGALVRCRRKRIRDHAKLRKQGLALFFFGFFISPLPAKPFEQCQFVDCQGRVEPLFVKQTAFPRFAPSFRTLVSHSRFGAQQVVMWGDTSSVAGRRVGAVASSRQLRQQLSSRDMRRSLNVINRTSAQSAEWHRCRSRASPTGRTSRNGPPRR